MFVVALVALSAAARSSARRMSWDSSSGVSLGRCGDTGGHARGRTAGLASVGRAVRTCDYGGSVATPWDEVALGAVALAVFWHRLSGRRAGR